MLYILQQSLHNASLYHAILDKTLSIHGSYTLLYDFHIYLVMTGEGVCFPSKTVPNI